ncbi:hypothetical protein GCM10025870_31980 [Agromyces marinus]|uniref:Uncharacterized protein n=1 Tax=Agromyces marinus TaxID=1389020 RepID=A0ABN6YFJ5_9MICO|nr:hypothetical protein GCM10025870_31980 [Agromyces marinus]
MADQHSPFRVNVRDLVNRPGEMREQQFDVPAPETLGEGLVGVREGSDLGVDVRLESVHEGVLVTAEVDATAEGSAGGASPRSPCRSESSSRSFSRIILGKLSSMRFKTTTWILNRSSEMR